MQRVLTRVVQGVKIPTNVYAEPDLVRSASDADILVFVLPHQFFRRSCETLRGKIKESAFAVSLTKGFEVKNGKISLMSDIVNDILGIPCAALSGANVATYTGPHEAVDGAPTRARWGAGGRLSEMVCCIKSTVAILEESGVTRLVWVDERQSFRAAVRFEFV